MPEITIAGAISAFVEEINYPLVSKSNFRRHNGRGQSKPWASYAAFEQTLATHITATRPRTWTQSSLTVALKDRPVVVAFLFAKTTLDASNLPKSVLDALQGVLYANDAEVALCGSQAVRSAKDQTGIVAFAQLPPKATLLDQQAVYAELVRGVLLLV